MSDQLLDASPPGEKRETLDCVIVGAGPAGLTALEYLSRFHRKVVALGANGPSPRLLSIDRTYNLPGFPNGISGQELLSRLAAQATAVGGAMLDATAVRVDGSFGNFTVQLSDGSSLTARTVILAMGVNDRHPDISNIKPHIGRFVRYCPVCDGYEHTGKHLGIIGSGGTVARHALFLRTFSHHITIFLHGQSRESLGFYKDTLAEKGIDVVEPRVVKILEQPADVSGDDILYQGYGLCLEDGKEHPLDVLYSALGCDLPLEPVRHLPLDLDEDGYIRVDCHQETDIPGLYAAGDLVSQINQISVAFGQAAIAAVSIQNKLYDHEGGQEEG
jgi:thioredoxin reductase (NADPH)